MFAYVLIYIFYIFSQDFPFQYLTRMIILRGVILVSLNLPVQLVLFPTNPPLHLHWKSPMVLVQVALE